jgi:hypothetical protein
MAGMSIRSVREKGRILPHVRAGHHGLCRGPPLAPRFLCLRCRCVAAGRHRQAAAKGLTLRVLISEKPSAAPQPCRHVDARRPPVHITLDMQHRSVLKACRTRLRRIAVVALHLLLASAVPAHAQSITFAPVDEGAANHDWQAYKQRLLAALEQHDRRALIGAIDLNVDNGPGQQSGLEEFQRRWSIEDEKSPLWRELQKAVLLGGAFVKDERGQARFCTPYVAARWPTDFDPFRFGAIVADEVLVKSEPSSGARTLARLGYELVPVEDWEVADAVAGFPQKWTRIRIRDQSGYVPEELIRSPIEHMACFSGQGGAWRLVSFTAGYLPE